MIDEYEDDGTWVFIAVLKYEGREYVVTTTGHTSEAGAEFMWTDGNYSCDCNRSIMIRQKYGTDFMPELFCGETIELVRYDIVRTS